VALLAKAGARDGPVDLLVDDLDALRVYSLDLLAEEDVGLDELHTLVRGDLATAVAEEQVTKRRIPQLAGLEGLLVVALFISHRILYSSGCSYFG
jgi:hypothetical protein